MTSVVTAGVVVVTVVVGDKVGETDVTSVVTAGVVVVTVVVGAVVVEVATIVCS